MSNARQLDMFGPPPPPQNNTPTPESVRAQMFVLIAKVKAATVMPWPARDARAYKTIFPQMGKWLPPEEAQELCALFMAEMARLEAS